jgi:hypothetical protein
LTKLTDGSWCFAEATSNSSSKASKGWILVFEVDGNSKTTPNSIRITQAIRTDSQTLARLAFEKAPAEAMNLLASVV